MEAEQVNDGRPKGWTEALALQYIAEELTDDHDLFAALFLHGDWHEIHKTFPEFVRWMRAWN